ncbi:MAG: hypothetical protein A2133_06900 [Actinobacteria bacterium RBG_16_64_13]|nr:MAG: hypothetical protein A2133_06900 [Actinobacteria bacterium RBG_16_64_13]
MNGLKTRRRSTAAVLLLLGALAWTAAACEDETSKDSPASSIVSGTSVTAAVAGPFASEDLRDLVLMKEEGNGLVDGLLFRPTYSGTVQLTDIRHWTLVTPERLETAGFAGGYANLFFTNEFSDDFGKSGRSLLTAALLFETVEGAAEAVKIFADSRDELWEEWQPLAAVSGANGIAQIGRQGTDNISDIYPTIGFGMQVANVYLLVGSQGGAQSGDPLPEALMRSLAEELLARAQDRLAEIER